LSIRKRISHASVATAAAALLAGGVVTAGVVAGAPSAAAAGSSFTCTAATDFLVADGQLFSAPEPTSPVSTAPAFAKVGTVGPVYNAMAFDPKDNYLYALVDGDVSQPAGYGGNDVLQIDPATGAITDLGRVSGLLQTQVSGGFDASGNFWVSDGYGIHEIDLTTSPPTVTKTMYVSQGYVTDITYAFGSWWGFNQGFLDKIDPANGNVTEEFTPPLPGFGPFNGQAGWTYANGDIGFAWTGGGLSTQWARITGLGGTPSLLYGPTFMSGVTGLARASDADGASCEPLQVGSPMPAGTYGSTYNESVSVSGGTAPYTVSLVGGSLPPGLTMSNGDITGTPTQAGTYSFTVQESDSNGLFGTGTISLTINPVTLTVTVSGSQSYGGPPTFTQTNDAPSSVTLDTSTLSCTTAGGSPLSSLSAGSYTLDGSSCSGITPPANYKINYVGAAAGFTVNPVALSVTASNGSMTYGGAVPSISASYSGFVNGDTSGSLTTPPTCSTTATSSSPVGTYPSSCSGAAEPNYSISYVNGTVSVTRATPQISWSSPGAITWGTALSGTQLDATAAVPGTFTYTPKAGTVLGPGTGQTLSVSFHPNDTTDYTDATAGVTINVVFSPASCITGKYAGPLVIGAGQAYCVRSGAVINSGVIVKAGGALYMTGGVIKGSLNATGAAALTMCGTSLSGNLIITGSTGPLTIGTCGTNTIAGSVSITGNTGGLTYRNNTVSGSLTITNNTGGFGTLSGNTTTGTVTINNNS
jgi:hypothetical protein